MQTMFECKVQYMKGVEGTDEHKKVTEVFLFDALTYTEAEKLAYERLGEVIPGDFMVTGIRKAKYAEIINSDAGGYWYRVKVSFLMVDENSGKEKRVSQSVLTLAFDIKDAVDRTIKAMGDSGDFQVKAVVETGILDFFPYQEREDGVEAVREVGRRLATPEEIATGVVGAGE